MEDETSLFRITDSRGFHMTFANGNTISVRWGEGNYCDNHCRGGTSWKNHAYGSDFSSANAEIAMWDCSGTRITEKFIPNFSDNVKGYLSTDEVLALMVEVAK